MIFRGGVGLFHRCRALPAFGKGTFCRRGFDCLYCIGLDYRSAFGLHRRRRGGDFRGDFSRIDAYNALSRYDFCDYIEKKPVWKNSGDDGRVRQRLRKKRVKPWRNIQNRNRGIHIRNDILPDSLRFISREGELDGRTGGVPLFAKEFDRIYGGCGK